MPKPRSAQQELFDKLDHLIAQYAEAIRLTKEYKRAILIANMLNLPPKELTGAVGTAVVNVPPPYQKFPWRKAEFVITRDGEEVFRKPLSHVDTELWPDDMRGDYERYARRKENLNV